MSKLHKILHGVHVQEYLAPKRIKIFLNLFFLSNRGTVHARAPLSMGSSDPGHQITNLFQHLVLM